MNDSERFQQLLEKYLDGQADPGERRELKERLASDPGSRARFIELLHQEAALRSVYRKDEADGAELPARPGLRLRLSGRSWAGWVTRLAAAVLVGIGLFSWLHNQPAAARALARLEQVQGEVYVLTKGERIPARIGALLLSGQGVEVAGEEGLAVLRFADSSRLELGAGTVYADQTEAGRKFTLSGDSFVVADVAESAESPLILVTPHGEVVARESRLSLSQAPEATHVDVETGSAVVHYSGGRSVEVKTGFGALVAPRLEPMVPQPAAPRLTTARLTWKDHASYLAALALAPDGQTVAVGLGDGTVKLCDVHSGKTLDTLGRPTTVRVRCLAFSGDSQWLAAGFNDGAVKRWQIGAARSEVRLAGHSSMIFAVAFSADGQSILSAGKDGLVKVWEAASGVERSTIAGCTRSAQSAAFTADGKTLAVGDWHNLVRLYDLPANKPRATFAGDRLDTGIAGGIFALAFTPDRSLLAAGSSDGSVTLWDLTNRHARVTLYGHKGKVVAADFSPDGRTLATAARDGTIRIWDVAAAAEYAVIPAPRRDNFGYVVFAPDGKSLATGHRAVQLWDLPGEPARP